MTEIIISNNLRDAVSAVPKEEAAMITTALPAFTELIEQSDHLDDNLKILISHKQKLQEEITHFQEKIRMYAIERAELNRVNPHEQTPEVKEDKRRREALDFLGSL